MGENQEMKRNTNMLCLTIDRSAELERKYENENKKSKSP